MMLDSICRHIRNYFPCVKEQEGTFKIENNAISLPFANSGDYILIEGSKLNDGIYKYTSALELYDETFDGIISIRAIPPAFIALVNEIETFVEDSNNKRSAMTSESFGGYSYSKASGASGVSADWQTVFRERLNTWRKI